MVDPLTTDAHYIIMWRKTDSLIMYRALVLTCLLCVSAAGFAAQAERTPTTLVMARHLRRLEPTWQYVGGWCTCPPTLSGQVWRDNATWERTNKDGLREFVDVEIVKGSSSDETADWMRRVGSGNSSSCHVEAYLLGDQGFLLTCPQSFKGQLNYRSGPYLVRVRGDSPTLVERFAKYTLSVVAAL
jgi:hypothetical protein